MFGILKSNEIESLITGNILGRIGFNDGSQTYIFPITYAYRDKVIYCHTQEGMKLNIMRKHPEVCFQVDEITNMANWSSVLCWGKFTEITGQAERAEAIRLLADRDLPLLSSETTHLFPNWPFEPNDLNELEGIIFKIEVEKSTGRYEKYDKYSR